MRIKNLLRALRPMIKSTIMKKKPREKTVFKKVVRKNLTMHQRIFDLLDEQARAKFTTASGLVTQFVLAEERRRARGGNSAQTNP